MNNENIFEVSLDQGALIVEFNDYAESVTGYTKDEVLYKNWFEIFIKPTDMVGVLKVFNGLFQNDEKAWENTNDIICKDGSKVTFKWSNEVLFDELKNQKFIKSKAVIVD